MNGDHPLSSRLASLSRVNFNTSLGVSLLALFIGAIVVLSGLVAIGSAAFGPGVGKIDPEKELDALVVEHNEHIKTWQDRLNGRSPFFKPSPPATKVTYQPPIEIPKPLPEQPKEQGPPSTYQGPPIAFAADDTVYFNSPTQGDSKVVRVRVGEEQEGLRVISMSLPWSVKIGHKGGEYDVPLFNRSDQSAFVKGSSQPVILQESFITAVSPAPDVVVPPPIAPVIDPAVAQAATVSGEGAVQPHPRGQPARAVAQPEPDRAQREARVTNPQRPPRGAPPEGAPPAVDEDQPIEESGVEEEPEEEDVPVEEEPEAEEDPDAARQVDETSPPPDAANPQSSGDNLDDGSEAGAAPGESK